MGWAVGPANYACRGFDTAERTYYNTMTSKSNRGLALLTAHVSMALCYYLSSHYLLEPWLLNEEVACRIGSYITLANLFIILLIEYVSSD